MDPGRRGVALLSELGSSSGTRMDAEKKGADECGRRPWKRKVEGARICRAPIFSVKDTER